MQNTLLTFITVIASIYFCNAGGPNMTIDNLPAELVPFRDECLKEAGVALEDAKDWRLEKEPSNEELCFLKCFKTKMGYINEDGTINVELLEKEPMFQGLKEDAKEKISACMKESDPIIECSDVTKFWQCFRENISG